MIQVLLVGLMLSGCSVLTGDSETDDLDPALLALALPTGPTVTPPSNLSYSNMNAVYLINYPITNNTPTVTGDVTSYSWASDFSGLSLDTSTGVISGTISGVTFTSGSRTVRATNAGGSATASVSIIGTTSGYRSTTLLLEQNQATSQEFAVSNSSGVGVTPGLPTGLSISSTTGVISGTPTSTTGSSAYNVTGTGPSGAFSTTVNIKVASTAALTCNTSGTFAGCSASFPFSCSETSLCFSTLSGCRATSNCFY